MTGAGIAPLFYPLHQALLVRVLPCRWRREHLLGVARILLCTAAAARARIIPSSHLFFFTPACVAWRDLAYGAAMPTTAYHHALRPGVAHGMTLRHSWAVGRMARTHSRRQLLQHTCRGDNLGDSHAFNTRQHAFAGERHHLPSITLPADVFRAVCALSALSHRATVYTPTCRLSTAHGTHATRTTFCGFATTHPRHHYHPPPPLPTPHRAWATVVGSLPVG